LATVIDQIEPGYHVFLAWKNAFLKQYEKFSRYLRTLLQQSARLRPEEGTGSSGCGAKAIPDHHRPLSDGFQAECLHVHIDFPLLQRLALPITIGSVRHSRIKIYDVRIIRLLEVLLHGGNTVGGWTPSRSTRPSSPPSSFPRKPTGLNLRKLKDHGLLERDGSRYAYRLTPKGVQVALLLLLFTNVSAGRWPTADSITNPTPRTGPTANSKPLTTRLTRLSRTSLMY
jgi:hypothetical protein